MCQPMREFYFVHDVLIIFYDGFDIVSELCCISRTVFIIHHFRSERMCMANVLFNRHSRFILGRLLCPLAADQGSFLLIRAYLTAGINVIRRRHLLVQWKSFEILFGENR